MIGFNARSAKFEIIAIPTAEGPGMNMLGPRIAGEPLRT